jgi:hypothetical protein
MKKSNDNNIHSKFPTAGELFCTLCGRLGDVIKFKKGYICNKCLLNVKAN